MANLTRRLFKLCGNSLKLKRSQLVSKISTHNSSLKLKRSQPFSKTNRAREFPSTYTRRPLLPTKQISGFAPLMRDTFLVSWQFGYLLLLCCVYEWHLLKFEFLSFYTHFILTKKLLLKNSKKGFSNLKVIC